MANTFKSNQKYKQLVEYMKKNIKKTSFSEIKKHLKKSKWPEEWIIEAKKDASQNNISKPAKGKSSKKDNLPKSLANLKAKASKKGSTKIKVKSGTGGLMNKARESNISGLMNKAKNFESVNDLDNKFERLQEDIAEIKGNTRNGHTNYVQSLFEKHDGDQKHFYERSSAEQAKELKKTLSEKETSKIMKDAMELAKQVVSNKQQVEQSAVERLFDVQEEDIKYDVEEAKKQAEIEKERFAKEREEFEKRRKQLHKERADFAKTGRQVTADEVKNDEPAGVFSEKLQMIEDKLKAYEGGEKEYRNPVIEEELEYTFKPLGNRAETGIEGLDPIMQGGIRRESVTMIAGGPGSGKTIFGMQFLVNGAVKFDEPGIFITFEQTRDELKKIFIQFDWDLDQLEKDGKLIVLKLNPEQVNKLLEAGGGTLRDAIEAMKARRLVIDSMSDFLMLYDGDLEKRSACISLFSLLDKMGVTSLVISEQETDPLKHISNILEYQVDGVILLYNERIGHIRQRALEIFKMRGTKHAGRIFPMSINTQGIKIKSEL